MASQPTDTTCGPTCLHAVYSHFDDSIPLEQLIGEIPTLKSGGTLGVFLGIHALRRGYRARLYTYNLRIFDPTWFSLGRKEMIRKLSRQLDIHRSARRLAAIRAYREFLELGGSVRMHDLSGSLLRKYLSRNIPILTGLSATFLYQACRERPDTGKDDDEHGEPLGHFVVLRGYDRSRREILVADPYEKNPLHSGNYYSVSIDRLITSILLGILTYDANLLILQPAR